MVVPSLCHVNFQGCNFTKVERWHTQWCLPAKKGRLYPAAPQNGRQEYLLHLPWKYCIYHCWWNGVLSSPITTPQKSKKMAIFKRRYIFQTTIFECPCCFQGCRLPKLTRTDPGRDFTLPSMREVQYLSIDLRVAKLVFFLKKRRDIMEKMSRVVFSSDPCMYI